MKICIAASAKARKRRRGYCTRGHPGRGGCEDVVRRLNRPNPVSKWAKGESQSSSRWRSVLGKDFIFGRASKAGRVPGQTLHSHLCLSKWQPRRNALVFKRGVAADVRRLHLLAERE